MLKAVIFFWLILLSPSLVLAGAEYTSEPVLPLSTVDGLDPREIALGDRLFHDPRLSRDNTISCASCHRLAIGGVDRMRFSPGVGGQSGIVNSPTVYNSGYLFVQFWDGRSPTLEAQAAGPIQNPLEMNSNWEEIIPKLSSDPDYPGMFKAIYPDGIQPANIQKAIAVFERSLVTTDAPFDHWLQGDEQAITSREKRGYTLFKTYGCVACHQGANLGGNLYQRMGVMGDYFKERGGEITEVDLGRFNVTGLEEDRYLFKVPSLRLAVLTPPYFHDGSAETIEEAIQTMALFQLGRPVTSRDMVDITHFLHTVLGAHPRLQP